MRGGLWGYRARYGVMGQNVGLWGTIWSYGAQWGRLQGYGAQRGFVGLYVWGGGSGRRQGQEGGQHFLGLPPPAPHIQGGGVG